MPKTKSSSPSARPRVPRKPRKKANGRKIPVARLSPLRTPRNPLFQSRGPATTLSNRELLLGLSRPVADTAFHTISYSLQPGDSATFPWLSAIANRYETYHFRSLSVHYTTRSTAITPGQVGACFDHDAADPPPLNLFKLMGTHEHIAGCVYDSWTFPIDLNRQPATLYTRSRDLVGVDIKTYDLGNLHLFTDSITSDGVLGLIEISYVVDLFIPQLDTTSEEAGTFVADAEIMNTNLLGNMSLSAGSPPVTYDADTGTMTFTDAWEGLFSLAVDGGGMVGYVINTCAHYVATEVLHTAYSTIHLLVTQKIKAIVGTTIKCTFNGTHSSPFTFADMDFIPCVYDLIS